MTDLGSLPALRALVLFSVLLVLKMGGG